MNAVFGRYTPSRWEGKNPDRASVAEWHPADERRVAAWDTR